jgi:hypothetical protein
MKQSVAIAHFVVLELVICVNVLARVSLARPVLSGVQEMSW